MRLSWALFLAAACVVVYANGLTGAFTYDDKAIVRDNLRLRSVSRAGELFTTQYFGGPPGTGTAYRPILLLSFALQWWIHGGEPLAFHSANVLLHAAATLLFAALLLRLGASPPLAVGAGLLFAVHPIHVEAVTGVVGRGETQSAVLGFAFLLASLRFVDARSRGRRGRWLLLALVAYALASLTKESAAVAPALLMLCLMARDPETRGLSVARRAWNALRRGLPVYLGSAAVLAATFVVRARVLGGPLRAAGTGIFALENPLAPLPWPERARNACDLFFRYLGRMAFPLRLSSDESVWSIPLLPPRALLGWACAGLLCLLVILSVGRLRDRSVPAFGFLWLCLASLPTANLAFPTGTIFAERLAYWPSAGFCLIAAAWIVGSARFLADVTGARVAVLAACALAFSVRTVIRNPVWDGDEALFSNMVRVSPDSAKAHYDFAYMSAEKGDLRTALAHYTRATQIYPGYWDAWAGRGRMERELGDFAASEAAYAESLRLAPFAENGYFGVGMARESLGDLPGAERAYRDGLRGHPQSLPLAFRLALVLSAEGRPGALHAFHRALAIEPGSLPARTAYAEWLARAGRRDEARAQLAEVLRRGPKYEPALRLRSKLQDPKSKMD
ncbi:MAG TPA: tetratricopeptide repeat protein [Thermoanaerobaculia bacterium]|jgi:Flp pilus assembly protein TadD